MSRRSFAYQLLGYSVVKVLGTLTIESLVPAAAMLKHGGGVVYLPIANIHMVRNSAIRNAVKLFSVVVGGLSISFTKDSIDFRHRDTKDAFSFWIEFEGFDVSIRDPFPDCARRNFEDACRFLCGVYVRHVRHYRRIAVFVKVSARGEFRGSAASALVGLASVRSNVEADCKRGTAPA